MADTTINFGDLVLRDSALEVSEKKEAKPKRCANAPVFECVSSGNDFVIKRTTAKTSRLLVVLVSQEQYYVKDERSGKVEALSESNLESFFQGLGETYLEIGCSWMDSFYNCKGRREILAAMVTANGFKLAASSGMMRFDDISSMSKALSEIKKWASYMKKSAPLVRSIADIATELDDAKKEAFLANLNVFFHMFDIYGLDQARKFVERLVKCSAFENSERGYEINVTGLYEILFIVPKREFIEHRVGGRVRQLGLGNAGAERIAFQFEKLCSYLFDQSAREGFSNLSHWIANWRDTLLMQIYVCGKVTDKYPVHLLTAHQILSTEAAHLKKEIDAVKWAEAEAGMQKYDFAPVGTELLITHPATPDDMRAEAVAQSNCLASYIGRVIDGRSMIFFARKAANPEGSFLTIEVDARSMQLAQVKARFNQEASDEAMWFLWRWCDEMGISLGDYEHRVRCLRAA